MERRTVLQLGGSAIAVSIAGCPDSESEDSEPTPTKTKQITEFTDLMRFTYENQFTMNGEDKDYSVSCSAIGGFNHSENRVAVRFEYIRKEDGNNIDNIRGRYLFEKGTFYQDIGEDGEWTTNKDEFFARVDIPSYQDALPVPVQLQYNQNLSLTSRDTYNVRDFGNSHYYNIVSGISSRGVDTEVQFETEKDEFVTSAVMTLDGSYSAEYDTFNFEYEDFEGKYSFTDADELELSEDWPTE